MSEVAEFTMPATSSSNSWTELAPVELAQVWKVWVNGRLIASFEHEADARAYSDALNVGDVRCPSVSRSGG